MGMRDLGQNVSRVLARVKKGESLVVTVSFAELTAELEALAGDEPS